jgi:hypothetical protein
MEGQSSPPRDDQDCERSMSTLVKYKWFYEEDEYSWQLFKQQINVHAYYKGKRIPLPTMAMQILKAPKKSSPMAEYWPTEEDAIFIVNALNRAERDKTNSSNKKRS